MSYQENNENLDVQIQLLNEKKVYELGDTASYTITITNIGDSALSSIETHLLTDSTNTIIDTESSLSTEGYYTVNGSYIITDDDVKNGSHTLTIFFAYTESDVDYCTKMYEMIINTNPNDPYTMYAFNTLDELGDNQIAEFRDVSALHNSNNIGDALIGYMTDTSPITTIDQFITKYFGNRIVKIKTFFADLLSALNNALPKYKDVSGTTSANGNITLDLNASTYMVVGLRVDSSSVGIALPWSAGTSWYAHVLNNDGTVKSDTSVTIRVEYKKLSTTQ